MNGYFDRLGEELRRATELRYAPGGRESSDANSGGRLSRLRRRGQRFALGRWPRRGVLVVLVAGGTAAAATIPLLGGSHRLAGAVPQVPRAALLDHRLPNGLRYAVPVTPDLEAGDAGWCTYPVFSLPRSAKLLGGGGACAPASAGSVTIVAGGSALTNILNGPLGPRTMRQAAGLNYFMRQAAWLNFFVVSDRVASIKLGAASFVPAADPELAPGWRAIVTFTRGLTTAPMRFLDRHGRSINQNQGQPVESVPVTTVNPGRLPRAVCALGSSDLPGLGSAWEVVANSAPSRGARVAPDVLFSCARAWYAFPRAHAVYSAAILLNAQHPARRAPNLPGLTPSIRPGDYEEAARTAGHITAHRIGNAWLLVQGPDEQLRSALLHNISATGAGLHRRRSENPAGHAPDRPAPPPP